MLSHVGRISNLQFDGSKASALSFAAQHALLVGWPALPPGGLLGRALKDGFACDPCILARACALQGTCQEHTDCQNGYAILAQESVPSTLLRAFLTFALVSSGIF